MAQKDYGEVTRASPSGAFRPIMWGMREAAGSRPGHDGDAAVVDVGSFLHGVCGVCGWRGPARRSALRDLELHALTCECAPGRERLTARGRS